MRKTIAAALASIALMLFGAPAASATDYPPCPETATVQTITNGCALPDYPPAAKPAVNYLVSAFYVLQDLYADALATVDRQAAQIARQRERIDRLRDRVARLRDRLH